MSSSYSSLDWVLSHWVHFTVHNLDLVVFICVYFVFFSYCLYVVLLPAQWGGPNGIKARSLGLLFFQCFDTVGWVYWPIKPVPDMTYNVFGGTLNPTQLSICWASCVACISYHNRRPIVIADLFQPAYKLNCRTFTEFTSCLSVAVARRKKTLAREERRLICAEA